MSILNFETAVGLGDPHRSIRMLFRRVRQEVDPNTKLETEFALLHLTCSLVYKTNVDVLM